MNKLAVKIFTFLILILFASVNNSFAKIYFVKKTGSDTNIGTRKSPFLTIQKALDSLKNKGDEVWIYPGEYNESLNANGTPYNKLAKIKGIGKNIKVIGGADSPALYLGGTTNWLIENITFSGGSKSVISAYNSNKTKIKNCTITGGSPEAGLNNGIAVLSCSNFSVLNCKVDAYCSVGINYSNSLAAIIKGNDVSNANAILIDFSAGCDNSLIEGNYLHDKLVPATSEMIFIECRDNTGSIIRRNLIVDKITSGNFQNGILVRGPHVDPENILVENNTLIGEGTVRGIAFASNAKSTICRNNIVVGFSYSIASVSGTATLPSPGVTVNYNNFYGWSQSGIMVDDTISLFDITNSSLKENISADPLFVEPDENNYKLKSTSPCIDVGDPASSVPKGGGTRVDMGKYERVVP